MNPVRQPFNCNLIGQAAALAALQDTDYVEKSRELNAAGKSFLYSEFDRLGLRYIKTEGNFIMVFVNQSGKDLSNCNDGKGSYC